MLNCTSPDAANCTASTLLMISANMLQNDTATAELLQKMPST